LEEVGEEEYRIDRLLTTLALSGRLDTLGGIVFGGFTDCGREEKIREILFSCTPKHIPVLGGFPAGHLQNNHAFCEGARVTLDATHATLYFHPHEEE
jgi:muramoyltetrapeptide carboxypeptidase